jgi:exopolysaccharide production protein ExoQ
MNAPSTSQSPSFPLLLPGLIGFWFAARLSITFLFFQHDPQRGSIVAFALNEFLLLVVLFYSFGADSIPLRLMLRVPPFRWVLVFLTLGLCSLAWSATVSYAIAFAYWCELASQVAIVALILRTGFPPRVAAAVIHGYIAGACLIAAIAWLSPTMADLRPGNDDFFSPNAIGFTCAFAVFLTQYLSRIAGSWTFTRRAAAIFLALTLLRSLSKTTILAFALAQLFLLLRDATTTRITRLWLCALSVAVLVAFAPLLTRYYVVYSNTGNQAETLTGRLGIWAFVLQRSLEQPWIGHGFHSFRNVIPPFGSFEAWHAHNEILQQFYAYGLLGIFLLIAIYVSFYRYSHRMGPLPTKTFFAGLVLFIVIRGLGDTENFDLSLPLWFISLLSLSLPHANSQPLPPHARLALPVAGIPLGSSLS